MSQPGARAIAPHLQNPKSILADRSQNALLKMNYLNTTRVTFAQGAANRRREIKGSSTGVNQTPPGSPKDASSPGQKFPTYPNKYNFGIFQTGSKNRFGQNASIASTTKSDNSSVSGEVEGRNKGPLPGQRRSARQIAVLYPANKSNKIKSTVNPDSSTGVLLTKSKSADTTATTGKSASASSGKKLTRSLTSSLTSSVPRRKSGKKIKKRRKTKSGSQLDKDLEYVKPASLNEEYAAELNKIKDILRAVTAFDESTATEDGSVNYEPPSRNNIVTHYRYTADPSSVTVTSKSLSKASGHVRRPLSANELKQLLSSITRVVSLHQLPINTALTPTNEVKNTPNVAGASTATPTSVEGYRPHSNLDSLIKEALANAADSPSSKPKKKKSRKFARSSLSSQKGRSEVEKTKPGVSAAASSTSKGKPRRKKSRPKHKSERQEKSRRPHSKDSVSDSEKDPVKNALFLRRYFEESIRLANKKSSEESVDNGHDEEDKKPKKKKSKKTSVTRKESTKNTTRKTQKTTQKG